MATRSRRRPGLDRERLFYSGMAVFIAALVFVGFAPTWFLRGEVASALPLRPLAPLVIVHGTLFTCWIALFVIQAALVSAGRRRTHMRLGIATMGLAAAMVVVGLLTAARQAALGTGPPELPPLTWFAVPFGDMIVFAGLVAGGFAWRTDPQAHKRLMLCATALMLQPGVGRMAFIPMTTFVGPDLSALIAFLLATPLVAWDQVQRGRLHWATLLGLGALGGEQLVRLAVWRSETWLAMAGWIVGAMR